MDCRRCTRGARLTIVAGLGGLPKLPMNSAIVPELQAIVGPRNVLSRPEDLALYEYDGSVDRARPEVVVFPATTEDVSRIVKLAVKHDVPIVGRGVGTGHSGRALARCGRMM